MLEIAIHAKLVPEDDRLEFLPSKLPGRFLVFEHNTYDTLRHLSKDYSGGLWDFFELSNGGFYIAPEGEDDIYRVFVDTNGFEGMVSNDAAGVIASLYALYGLAYSRRDQRALDYYHQLKDFALEHKEAAAILGAID